MNGIARAVVPVASDALTGERCLDCLSDLQWVIDQSRQLAADRVLTDHERVQLVGWALQAAQDKMNLLRYAR